jgi:tRNA-dihydrouridine synthase B
MFFPQQWFPDTRSEPFAYCFYSSYIVDMNIGNLILQGKVFLAPLAGVADSPFRLIAKRFGAALVYTEMVSAEGMTRDNPGTLRMLDFAPEERPIAVQLFGANPQSIASACKQINSIRPDLIDLNCGCPVKKVVKTGGGAALLKDLKLLRKVIAAMVDSTEFPVTVKIRSGWDKESLVALEVAAIAQECEAAAITIHPRTQKESFSDKADWSLIAKIKKSVNIPVIGSGDIFSPQDAKEMLDQTGCDAVMIGRGALGNPWIFSRTNHFLKHSELLPEPFMEERIRICIEHVELSVAQFGEINGVRKMRKHMAWYTSGMPACRELRQKLFMLETPEQVKRTFNEYLLQIQGMKESTSDKNP